MAKTPSVEIVSCACNVCLEAVESCFFLLLRVIVWPANEGDQIPIRQVSGLKLGHSAVPALTEVGSWMWK